MEFYATVQTNEAVTHDDVKKKISVAILSRHSKWQKYVQNIYVNSVKTKPFILILNIHVRHSKRYKKTNSILAKVYISAYTWDWGLKVVLRGFSLYLHCCLNFEKKRVFVY